jgi:hypothetical protein
VSDSKTRGGPDEDADFLGTPSGEVLPVGPLVAPALPPPPSVAQGSGVSRVEPGAQDGVVLDAGHGHDDAAERTAPVTLPKNDGSKDGEQGRGDLRASNRRVTIRLERTTFEQQVESMRRLLPALEPAVARIVEMRFGLAGGRPMECDAISAALDITVEAVRLILDDVSDKSRSR